MLWIMIYVSPLKWCAGEQVYHIQHVYTPFYIQSLLKRNEAIRRGILDRVESDIIACSSYN